MCIRRCEVVVVSVVVVSVVVVAGCSCAELTMFGSSGGVVVETAGSVIVVSVTLTEEVELCGVTLTFVFVPAVAALPLPGALLLV